MLKILVGEFKKVYSLIVVNDKELADMEAGLKKVVSAVVISVAVMVVSPIAVACETSVGSIAAAKQELSKAKAVSSVALKSQVNAMLKGSCNKSVAVALADLGISPKLSMQALVGAGVTVEEAVELMVAADTEKAHTYVEAAVKIKPDAEVAIIQAAIMSGASIDDLPATAAGRDKDRQDKDRGENRSRGEREHHARRHDSEHGGGGVVTPPKPVSSN